MLQNNDYLIRKIFIYINEENLRSVMEDVCLGWKRNSLMINPPESYKRALMTRNLETANFFLNHVGKVISNYIKKKRSYVIACVEYACNFNDGSAHLDWILTESSENESIRNPDRWNYYPINIVTRKGFMAHLKVLLKHGYKITNSCDIYRRVYGAGHKEMTRYLLENTMINFDDQDNLISWAVELGDLDSLKYFLDNWRFKDRKFSNALYNAGKYKGKPKSFKLLLSAYKNNKVSPNVFVVVCSSGGVEQAKILINEHGMSPSLDQNMPIIAACARGNIEMIKFLLKYPEVNVFDRNNRAFQRAAKNEHQDVLDFLDEYKSNGCQLEKRTFKSCDSFDNLKKRFEKACYQNKHLVVKSILNDYLEDISSPDVLLFVIRRHYWQTFDLLINDWRFRFKREMLRQIIYEAASAPYEYFMPLLKYSAEPVMFRLLVGACRGGDERSVNYLLENYQLDPSKNANICILEACIYGHLQVVKILLKYPNVDPHDRNDKAYRWAKERGHTDIIEYLDNRLAILIS